MASHYCNIVTAVLLVYILKSIYFKFSSGCESAILQYISHFYATLKHCQVNVQTS